MDPKYLENSQTELIRLLDFICKNRDIKVTPAQIKNELFTEMEMEEIFTLFHSIKYRRIQQITLAEVDGFPTESYLEYRVGLENYVFGLKDKVKKGNIHKILEFLCTESKDSKNSFDSEEIAKAFSPELNIYEVNRLCEVLIANGDVLNPKTDQSEAEDVLIILVTSRTRTAYHNKKYLLEEIQVGIPINPNVSASFTNIQNTSTPNIIQVDNAPNANNTKGKTTRLNILYWIIGIVVPILTFGYIVLHNNKVDNDEFRKNAINFKPELVIVKCKLAKFRITSLPIGFTKDDFKKDTIEKITQTIDSVQFDVVFKNVGNYHANILIGFYTDTTTGNRFLDNFQNKEEFTDFIKKNKPEYYSDIQIRPGEEFATRIKTRINFIKDKMFTIHIRIIYKNSTNNVYDSYSWYRGKINDFILGTYFNIMTGQLLNPTIENSEDIISLVDSNKVFYPYSRTESKKMLKYFPQLDK